MISHVITLNQPLVDGDSIFVFLALCNIVYIFLIHILINLFIQYFYIPNNFVIGRDY